METIIITTHTHLTIPILMTSQHMHQGFEKHRERETNCKVSVLRWNRHMLPWLLWRKNSGEHDTIITKQTDNLACNQSGTASFFTLFCIWDFTLLDNPVIWLEKWLQATHTRVSVCISSNSHHALSSLALLNYLACLARVNSIVWKNECNMLFLFPKQFFFPWGLRKSNSFKQYTKKLRTLRIRLYINCAFPHLA